MILKTLNIATLLVVVWLLWNHAALQRAVSNTNNGHAVTGQVLTNLRSELKKLEDKVDEPAPVLAAAQVQAQPDANQTAEINALKAQISGFQAKVGQMNRSKELKETLNQIVQADFDKTGNAAEAAEKLLSTKEVIWRTSTEYKSVEQTLQSLMAPIDILAGEWQQGYTDNTVATIHRVLSNAITVLDREGVDQR